MAWRDRFFGRRATAAADDDWRRRCFGIATPGDRLGLLPAPERAEPSAELVAARELDEREVERVRAIDRRIAAEIREANRRRQADQREQARRDADAAIAELIAVHGRAKALAFVRRHDPDYQWPDEGSE